MFNFEGVLWPCDLRHQSLANRRQNYTSMVTAQQYDEVIGACKKVFIDKAADYGTSWRMLRIISVADQLFIKARRIRTLQEKQTQRVSDGIRSEFMGIVNYSVIGLLQLELPNTGREELPLDLLQALYDARVAAARQLMTDKNHDYGEAWRDMSQESFVDLILVKLLRIRQILANHGRTSVSEGIDANLFDILNYAVFALILITEGKHQG